MASKRVKQLKEHWIIRSLDRIIFLIVLFILFIFIPGQNAVMTGMMQKKTLEQKAEILAIPTPAPLPVNSTGIFPGAEISAVGVVVRDVASGQYMYKRNENLTLSPASTTKLLTALVSLDSYKLDDVVTVDRVETEGQTMGLYSEEKISVESLLYGALIHSGNDAAYALAEHYPSGYDGFVKKMNEKAQELGLIHSSFTNPIGFDDVNHMMTATDLMVLSTYAVRNPIIARAVAIPEITVSDVSFTRFHKLKNVNQLLGKIPGVGGIKTGWTEASGQNLVTLVQRNGHRVILVVLRSEDRFVDTENLINWVFSNFTWQTFTPPNTSTL